MKTIFAALRVFIALTIVTGLAYPLAITVISHLAFPSQASGSVLTKDRKTIGSELLAQEFTGPGYFWTRPSAGNFATVASGASNLGPTSAALRELIATRRKALQEAHDLPADAAVPDDLVTTSGSGLDPHLTPVAAKFQAGRVAKARHLSEDKVLELIKAHTESPQFGIFGEARVNVLKLNLALDSLGASS
ncbi:MAG: hypothetical protein RL693_2110 [Verrucomicrobiota bacterium]|jgi:K+-transporting ATPase ATPase C chain